MNRSVFRVLVGVAGLAVLGMTATLAGAQTVEVKEKRGTYTFDPSKHTITFHIDRAGWPDWDETVQVRTYELKGDELSWKVAPRPDGSVPITVLRRVQ